MNPNQLDRLDHSNSQESSDHSFPQLWLFGAVNIMMPLKFGYYIVPSFPLNSNTNIGAYAYSPHFKNVTLDLAYAIFLFMDGYITRSTSPNLKEWVRGLVDLSRYLWAVRPLPQNKEVRWGLGCL
ncbi:hypothetical protein ABEY31_19915 [Bacillus mycoides]|uniref:hypothetical protein n=1 Tax=Bacillus mycoides TaxID=1405 RepID=UPI003D19483E